MRLRRKHFIKLILFAVIGFVSQHSTDGSCIYPPKLPNFTPTVKYALKDNPTTLKPEASTEGNPPPTYKWRKNGKNISSASDNSWLTIDRVGNSDFGTYHCVATNPCGSVVVQEVELVRARLEIRRVDGGSLDDDREVERQRGKSITLNLAEEIIVDSQPPPTISWFEFSASHSPSNEIFDSHKRAISEARGVAALLDLESDDDGHLVRVRFENPTAGITKDSPRWVVRVLPNDFKFIAPKIVIPPADAVIKIGGTATFDCVANANPLSLLRYDWTKDGVPLTTDFNKYEVTRNGRTLVVNNVVEDDRGVYACVTRMIDETTHPGRDRREANLIIHSLPRIFSTSMPNISSEVFWGRTKVLRCEGEGTPTPSVTWFKDAIALPSTAWSHIAVNANQSLVVNRAGKADEGIYQCVIRNEAGSASTYTVLKVKELKPNIFDIPRNTSVISGDAIVLKCPAEGAPPPTFSWTKDGSQVVASSGTDIDSDTGTLTISSSSDDRTGEYCCQATNQFGDASKCTHVRVAARTIISEPPADSSVIISTTAYLHCGVSHDPNIPIIIDWLFSGDKIDYDSRRTKDDDGTLRIKSVGYEDAGNYTCSVKSTNGNDQRSATIKVIELPFAPTGVNARVSTVVSRNAIVAWVTPEDGNSPITNYLIQGQIVSLPNPITTPIPDSANQSSEPNFDIDEDKWVTLVKDAPASTSHELTRLSPSATYVFRVSAINAVGEGPYSAHSNPITIPQEAPSEAPLDFQAKSATMTTIMTEWKQPPKSGWNGVLRGYIIEFRLTGYTSLEWDRKNITDPDQGLYRLENLMVFRKYDVRIAAYNDRGIGVFSETLSETTVEGTPTHPPADVSVVVADSTSIRVSWLPPSVSSINGVNQGYKVRVYNVDTPVFCPPGCNSSAHRAEKEVVVVPIVGHVGRYERVVGGLQKYNRYNVTVLCFTSAGNGVESDLIPVLTDQDLPGKISTMHFPTVLDSSVTVVWEPPRSPNGVIVAYTVYYAKSLGDGGEQSRALSAETTTLTIPGLSSQTSYTVSITASTSVGEGPRETSEVKSGVPPVLPQPASNLAVTDITSSTALLRFTPGLNGKTSISKWTVEGSIVENDGGSSPWTVIFSTTDPGILDTIRVQNLRPYTQYVLRIIKENVVGSSGPSTTTRQFQTRQAAPDGAPEDVILRAVNATAIRVTWTPLPLIKWNGEPSGYMINSSSADKPTVVNDPNINTVVLGGLDEWTSYSFSMAAYNTYGTSQYRHVGEERTMEDVPSAGPTGVKAESINDHPTQLLVSWDPVPAGSENGDIQGFSVRYAPDGGGQYGAETSEQRVSNPLTRSIILTNLRSFTTYGISVAAYTRVGSGVESGKISARTGESTPEHPSDVMFPDVGRDFVNMSWNEPKYPNGDITGYQVEYRLKREVGNQPTSSGTLPPTARWRKFPNLNPENYYTFSIKAKGNKGWGPALSLDVFTRRIRRVSDPPAQPNVARGQTEARSITINLNSVEGDAPTRYFTVQYQVYGEVGSGGEVGRSKREARSDDAYGGAARSRYNSWRTISSWSSWETYEPYEKILATDSSHVLKNLQPYTKYRFRASATNDVGTSDFSQPSKEIVTKADTPGLPPVDITVTPITETSVEVTFLDPPRASWYGPALLGYIVQYRTLTRSQWIEKVKSVKVTTPSSTRRPVELINLTKDERYEIKAMAYSAKGSGKESRVIVVDVGVAVPSGAPRFLSSVAVSSTQLNVDWKAPPENELNGNLLGYKLFFLDAETGIEGVRISGYKKEHAVLENLRKHAPYNLKILAYNSAGDGRNSSAVGPVRTMEDFPGIPKYVEFFNLTLNSLKLQWGPPVEANGVIIGYEIVYEEEEPLDGVSRSVKVQVAADRLEHDVQDLVFHARYNFSVRAKTSVGYGPFKSSVITVGPQKGSPGPVSDLRHRSTTDALVLYWKYSEINQTVGFILEKRSRDIVDESENDGRSKRSPPPEWSAWDLEVKESSKITGYKLKWRKLKQGSEYKFRVVAFNYQGPSSPVETPDPIRPQARIATAWWAEGWFKIVVAIGGLIIVAILVATFIVVGRNNNRKEQSQMKRQGTMQRVEHVRPGMGHSNPVDVSDEMVNDAGGGFATCDLDQRQSLRKSIKRAVNNNPRQNSYREPPLPTPAANYSEDDDEEDTSFSQGNRNKNEVSDDVTSKGEGDSGSSELTGKDIDDSLSADEEDDEFPPPPPQLNPATSIAGFSTLPQNYSQYARNVAASGGISASTNQLSPPTSSFQSQPENPYSALHSSAYDPGRPPTHPNRAALTQSQYMQQQQQQQQEPRYQHRASDNHNAPRSQPSGQTPRQSDSPRVPPPYGGLSTSQIPATFTPPGSHYGGSQGGSQFGGSQFVVGGRMTSSPLPPPPPPVVEDDPPSVSSSSQLPTASVSPRGLASGAHFDSSSFVNHYSSANEVLANGGSLRRQPKRRPPSANNSSHYGGGGSDRGSDISLTEVGNSAGLFGARISHSPAGGGANQPHQQYYLNQGGAGSRAPLPGFSSFV